MGPPAGCHPTCGAAGPRRNVPVRPGRASLVPFGTVTAGAALAVASLFALQANRTRGELDTERETGT
ncbi:hypothetical protein FM21_09565 [Streptomyces mutabilis]|uniref:Uncharacterized protein n=1 Tax=Streptomyces mutabilis TaxID=67332 RepID=A0A086N5B4_9ACTN|nr:hypothetical protein FM21_09565 [Streptomyces mutabilis]